MDQEELYPSHQQMDQEELYLVICMKFGLVVCKYLECGLT